MNAVSHRQLYCSTVEEIQLSVSCLRSYYKEGVSGYQWHDTLLNQHINWNTFLAMVAKNRATLLVYNFLASLKNTYIPSPVLNVLRQASLDQVGRQMQLFNELCRVTKLLSLDGITVILFKGPVLAQFYKDPYMRSYGDLDIIIKKDELRKVEKILVAGGYRPSQEEVLSYDLQMHHSYHFKCIALNIELDVHWEILDQYELFDFPIDQFWNKAFPSALFGGQALVPHIHQLILATCVHHGIRNAWNELRFINDLGAIIHVNKELDWKQLLHEAEHLRIKKAFLTGASLAEYILGINLPQQLIYAIDQEKHIKAIRSIVAENIFKAQTPFESEFNRLRIRILLRDSLITRTVLYYRLFKYYALVLYRVSIGSSVYSAAQVPGYLKFLLVFIRPLRLVYVFIKSLAGTLGIFRTTKSY